MLFIVNENNLTNYTGDTTPYAIESDSETLLNSLVNDTSILIKCFNDNYFKMNTDKCNLLITNHDDNVSVIIDVRLFIIVNH